VAPDLQARWSRTSPPGRGKQGPKPSRGAARADGPLSRRVDIAPVAWGSSASPSRLKVVRRRRVGFEPGDFERQL